MDVTEGVKYLWNILKKIQAHPKKILPRMLQCVSEELRCQNVFVNKARQLFKTVQ